MIRVLMGWKRGLNGVILDFTYTKELQTFCAFLSSKSRSSFQLILYKKKLYVKHITDVVLIIYIKCREMIKGLSCKSIIKTSYTMELIFHIIVICHPQVYHYLPDKSNLQLIYRKQHKTRTRQERPYEKNLIHHRIFLLLLFLTDIKCKRTPF